MFNQIPAFLSRHEKKIILSSIEKGINTENTYDKTFMWLDDSMIVNSCFKCNDPNVGLSLNQDDSAIKCYMGDTGLLFSMAFDENTINSENLYMQIMGDKLSINKGMLYENVIAQMLVANGHKLFFYSHYNSDKHRNDIEVDFILSASGSRGSRIIPIEVKSGKNYSTTSIEAFKKKFKSRIREGYIIHPKNLSTKADGILAVPPYMTMCL